MSTPNFETAINLTKIPGAGAQFVEDAARNRPRWEAGEAVPSKYYKVGSFVIAPGTIEPLEDDLRNLQIPAEIHTDREEGRWHCSLAPERLDRLKDFMYVVGSKFREFVAEDTGMDATDPRINVFGIVGPYEQSPDNTWHRDLPESVGKPNYVATLLGAPTEFGIGDFPCHAFSDDDSQFLHPEEIPEVTAPELMEIALFDQTIVAHQSPGDPALEGEPRIFYSCSVLPPLPADK